jgi:hypothetical protein
MQFDILPGHKVAAKGLCDKQGGTLALYSVNAIELDSLYYSKIHSPRSFLIMLLFKPGRSNSRSQASTLFSYPLE